MKKIILISGIVLFLLVLLVNLFLHFKRPSSSNQSPTPTLLPIPTQYGSKNNPKNINPTIAAYMKLPLITPIEDNNTNYTDSTTPENPAYTISDIKNGMVYKTENLKISYSSTLKKFIFNRKTHLAQMEIDQWAREEDVLDQIDNPDMFIDSTDVVAHQDAPLPTTQSDVRTRRDEPLTISPTSTSTYQGDETSQILNLFSELLGQYTNIPLNNTIDSNINQTPSPSQITPITPISPYSQITPIITLDNLVYYQQSGGPYDKYPLPQGCILQKAGCGPTTAAMVLSSWVNPGFDPPKTVDYYQSQNFTIGCNGSNIENLQKTLRNHGLKTTPIAGLNRGVANQVIEVFKKYLQDGYTAVVLAHYADNSPKCGTCGHFFWVVDVDVNNDIWALDVFYGRRQKPQPFNENSLYPYPKYIATFGVKK